MKLKTVIAFLRVVLQASRIYGSRGKLDIFADRLVIAANEPTLTGAMERLIRSVDACPDKLYPPLVTSMMKLATSPDAPMVLRWLREQAKLATMLAATNDLELVAEALTDLSLPEIGQQGVAIARKPYAIKISATCETSLAHGSDSKAGNASLFRKIAVMATNGSVLELPYYSGNAVRGQVRDLLADHFLRTIGLLADQRRPAIALWFFYALYSGGALEEKSDATKALKRHLGDNGSIRSEGIREFRDRLPALSLLGCALGNRVLPGHVQFADLRPVCVEWGTGTRPIAELLTWEFMTRREDYENHDEHHGMIVNTEVLKIGTELEGGVDMDNAMPEIEKSALGRGLALIAARGMLGAENRRGLGRVNMIVDGAPDLSLYDEWLREHASEIIEYLGGIGALAK